MKEIIYYQKENGKIPVQDFINSLKKTNYSLLKKIFSKLRYLQYEMLGEKDIKYIGDKIYELRIKNKNNISRIFYFSYEENKILLLDGIIKKEQKLKQNILKRVQTYRKDFLKQNLKK